MTTGVFELAIVVLMAAGLSIVAKLLKQPIILAYIAAGVLIGVFGFFNLTDRTLFQTFSDLGIMFVLFLVGLEINFTSLRLVTKPSLFIGVGQIIFTFIIGFIIAYLFNFTPLTSAYISIALTFSSTIIVIKLLSEKNDINSLYGKLSIGMLLVQDATAILLLIILAGTQNSNVLIFGNIVPTLIKGIVLFSITIWLGRKIFPLIFDKIAHSQELLFLSSLAWCFLAATAAVKSGFSIEIGGFLAGLALANSSEHFQIAARIRSLRDFFILIFFVILGSSLTFTELSGLSLSIFIFSLFVLIGNPLIVLIIMGLMGYRKRTSFLTGVTVAQISEFSLILAALGLKLGHIDEKTVSLITAVGIITIALSTYLILYAETIFRRLSKLLSLFERKMKRGEEFIDGYNKPIVLIGAHRTGRSIAASLPKEDLLIIDFDPDVISELKRMKYQCLFGDIADIDICERANLSNAKLIISTTPDLEDNLALLNMVKSQKDKNKKPKVIVRAEDEDEAKILYAQGVDYVLFPYFTSGQYLGKTITADPEMKILSELKKQDLKMMEKVESKI